MSLKNPQKYNSSSDTSRLVCVWSLQWVSDMGTGTVRGTVAVVELAATVTIVMVLAVTDGPDISIFNLVSGEEAAAVASTADTGFSFDGLWVETE
jgi:hypothetical protein